MSLSYLQRIEQATVYPAAVETPLERAPRLSERLGVNVLFKREDLQPVFSFKLRGAYNKIKQMPAAERANGVICSSAGNHAQGVSVAARELGIRAVVVMPVTTPRIKIEAVNALGGEIIIHGAAYDDAQAHALEIAAEQGLAFIHPFDDPDVIAGQGTISLEIHRQCSPPPDAIFVPVGGGGLIAGIAAHTKAVYPDVRIIGVEPEESSSMLAALEAGHPVTLERVGIFADGVAVRRVGDETFRLCRDLVDEIVTVTTDETCAAIRDIFEDTRTVVEPAGALAVAGLKKYLRKHPSPGATFVTLNCGANLNFDRLRHITERAAIGEQREALIAVEIPEQKGSFLAFCTDLGRLNVTEFNYRYGDARQARVFVGVELHGGSNERQALIERLRGAGYRVVDMSENELAKVHIRYMVGGLAPGLENERLYRFEFPERPGALLDFLTAIGDHWNISLFHYRNHGSDYGRVLTGIQLPANECEELEDHISELGYFACDETDNPAYRMFLYSQ